MSRRRGGPAARPRETGTRPSAIAEPERRDAYDLLRANYFLLDRSFNRLFAAATSDAERDALRRHYVTARDAYWEAQDRAFLEDDPLVEALEGELARAQETIEERIETLADISAALSAVAEAVRIGGALVTLGALRYGR